MMARKRPRFNLRMEISANREESLIVELMKEGDFLKFELESEERVEVINENQLITSGRIVGKGGWYANHYLIKEGVIRLDEPNRKKFRSYRAASDYCEAQKQRRKS